MEWTVHLTCTLSIDYGACHFAKDKESKLSDLCIGIHGSEEIVDWICPYICVVGVSRES